MHPPFNRIHTKIIVECALAATQFLDQRYVNPRKVPHPFFSFLSHFNNLRARSFFLTLTEKSFIVVHSIIHPFSSKIFRLSVLVILPNFHLTVIFVTVKQ